MRAGIGFLHHDTLVLNTSFFQREAVDLIDWVKETVNDPQWQAANIGQTTFRGLQTESRVTVERWCIRANYSYVDSDTKKEYISKYGLVHLVHHGTLSVGGPVLCGIRHYCQGVFQKRKGDEKDYFIVSAKLIRELGDVKLSIEGRNLFNARYEDNAYSYYSPRWFGATVEWAL